MKDAFKRIVCANGIINFCAEKYKASSLKPFVGDVVWVVVVSGERCVRVYDLDEVYLATAKRV